MHWLKVKRIGWVLSLGVLSASGLSGCGGSDNTATEPESKAAVSPVEPTVPVAPVVTEKKKKAAPAPLNLALPTQELAIAQGGGIAGGDTSESHQSENNKLPNLFNGDKKEGTTMGGGIIRDEENENYIDSIQGAEVNVEFSID